MSKPRIIGGSARGRPLDTPRRGTRPSPARLREALFDILAFRPRGRFLDLYSGSGAVGLEAASRGWRATCVDLSPEAAAVIAANARRTGLRAAVHRGDALDFAAGHPGAFELVFAAPPYPLDLRAIFAGIIAAGPAAAAGLYVFQHPSSLDLTPAGVAVTLDSVRRYGSNALTLLQVADSGGESGREA